MTPPTGPRPTAPLLALLTLAVALGVASCSFTTETDSTGSSLGDAGTANTDGSAGTAGETGDTSSPGDSTSDTTASPTTSPDTTDEPTEAPEPDGLRLSDLSVTLTPVVELEAPIALVSRAGSDRLYVAEKAGRVSSVADPGPNGEPTTDIDVLLDITDAVSTGNEQGLLGLEFSNDGRRMYVSYTDTEGTSKVDEYTMSEGTSSERVDLDTRREIVSIEQPFPNHNGGHLAFGPDGFLYLGFGDGGAGGDPLLHGQNTQTLLGTIMRVDVDIDPDTLNPEDADPRRPFDVPEDNPFFQSPDGLGPIWLYGVRNPWRFSFDSATGDLWIGDVGQNELEEIDMLPAADGWGKGANLGWKLMEGSQSFNGGVEPEGHVGPIFDYPRADGCSVTGGYVYRGERIPDMVGLYIYADYCGTDIRAIDVDNGEVVEQGSIAGLTITPQTAGSFAEDANGELYLLSLDGEVLRFDPA